MTQLQMFEVVTLVNRSPSTAKKARKRAEKLVRTTITARYEEFHVANPHVMAEMKKLAVAHLKRGDKRIGAKALWEELRQSIRVNKLGNWKLDNSLTALYGRALIDAIPELAGVIETRRRKAP